MNSSIEDIRAAIVRNNGMVVDDHRSDKDNLRKVYAIGKHGEKTVWLSNPEETPYFCINPLYLDEQGTPHLSRWSVGGLVELKKHGSLEAAIKAYNDPANWTAGYALVPVTDITYIQ